MTQGYGFNPCFDGSVARGRTVRPWRCSLKIGFNPCFDGSVARGADGDTGRMIAMRFQSLF